jgi:anti-sigma factor (TIGR02949 family)
VPCEQTSTLLHGYLDGELDAVRSAEFEQHLEGCSQCASELEAQERLRVALRSPQLYEKAPAGLARRVVRQIETVDRSETRAASGWFWPPWLRMATLATVAIVVGAFSSYFISKTARQNPPAETAVVAEAIDAHLRALQPGHLVDVESTDQHTVKPWFDGKLDFIPPVKDEAESGFPLIGGRLDALSGRTVAALVYGRRKHLINVFVWPAADSEPEARLNGSRNGYQWIYWKKGGMEFCAVSDVSENDLHELAELLQ